MNVYAWVYMCGPGKSTFVYIWMYASVDLSLPMCLKGAKSTVLQGPGWKYNVWAWTAGPAGVVCHITNCRCLSLKSTPTRENANNTLCDWTSSLW